jgi:hypothetical protein
MDKLTVPTLVLEPGLEGIAHEPGNNYMEALLHQSWEGCVGAARTSR